MKFKKYINKKSDENIDFYNTKLVKKDIYSIAKREFSKILSIIATVNIINWVKKRDTILIEYEVILKILYLDSNDSKIFLAKDSSFYYDEIDIKYERKYIDWDILLKEDMVKMGSNIQDIQILNINGSCVKLLVTILNWIEINETHNILIYMQDKLKGNCLYSTNNEIDDIKCLIVLDEDILTNVLFSKTGETIFYIRNRNNETLEIESFNLLDKSKKRLLESYTLIRFDIINKNEILYIEKSEHGMDIKVLNLCSLLSRVLINDLKVEIKDVYCGDINIAMMVTENSIDKVIILNKKGEILNSFLGEYTNIVLIDNDGKLLTIKDNDIYLIDINTLEIRKVIFNNLTLKQFKVLNSNEIIVYGCIEKLSNIILVNLKTLDRIVLFEEEKEVYEWFILSEDEILLSFKENKRLILKKIIVKKGIKQVGEIEGNIINMIVRGG